MLKLLNCGIKKYLPAGVLACVLALTVANGMAEIVTSMQYPTMPSASPGVPRQWHWADHQLGPTGSDMLIAAFPDLEYTPEEAAAASNQGGQPASAPRSVRLAADFELAKANHEASDSRAPVVTTGGSAASFTPMTGTGSNLTEASAAPVGPAPVPPPPADTDEDEDKDEKDEPVPVTPPVPGAPETPGGGMGTSTPGDAVPTR